MTNEQIKALKDVNRRIIKCNKCDFHRELPKGFHYKPDAPIFSDENYRNDYKVVVIGINPAWDESDNNLNREWQEIYSHDSNDYEGYEKKVLAQIEKSSGRNTYANGVAKAVNFLVKALVEAGATGDEILRELNIPLQTEIDGHNVYDYVFWTNQSFCNSQQPNAREFNKKEILCNTYTEEIPNCLKKGFLKDIVRIIGPRLLIFFGDTMYYKVLLQEILDVKYDSIHSNGPLEVEAYMRSEKPIKTNFYCAKVTHVPGRKDDVYAIFLYHPSARITDKGKMVGIKKICEELKSFGFIR